MVCNQGNQHLDINTADIPPFIWWLNSNPSPPISLELSSHHMGGGYSGIGLFLSSEPFPGQHANNVLPYSPNTHYVYRANISKCEIVTELQSQRRFLHLLLQERAILSTTADLAHFFSELKVCIHFIFKSLLCCKLYYATQHTRTRCQSS